MPRIYHFTHRDNLNLILAAQGLCCDSGIGQDRYSNVGNRDIKSRRFRCNVPVAPFGVVADYVPFYFAVRSPMLFAIHRGNVPSCAYGQDQVVYLICNTEDVVGNLQCCFSDRNAAKNIASFYNDMNQMNGVIDWPLMQAHYWANTEDDTERRERRMAEFLIHKFVPISFVRGIGTYDQPNRDYIDHTLRENGVSIPTAVKREWYF